MSQVSSNTPMWWRSILGLAVLGSLLAWASLPPLAWGWLGWLAPVPWLVLAQSSELPGRRPYLALYIGGLIYWLLAIYWLILPYPAFTWMGWLALSAYLAIYLPVFIALVRVAIFRYPLPLWFVAPVVWTGLELARAHLLTGFLMASLAHSQVKWTTLIQLSDLLGEYGVGFVLVLVASCAAEVLRIATGGLLLPAHTRQPAIPPPPCTARRIVFAIAPALVALAATLAYGHWRILQLNTPVPNPTEPPRRIALIQGNSQAEWKQDPQRERQIMDEYLRLSLQAVEQTTKDVGGRALDLVVWPETMFRVPLFSFDTGYQVPANAEATPEEFVAFAPRELAGLVARLGVQVLVGIDRAHGVADLSDNRAPAILRQYNSAVLVGRDGRIVGTYDKMHRVMFGEYIPFADWVPLLYRITPLTGGIVAGESPASMRLGDRFLLSPNICYETAIPHVIRRQVATLERRGERPNLLVNLTNDSWYRRSSELEMHIACDVFRAIETRVPLLVAANGGISAHIDRTGRVLRKLEKQQAGYLLVEVPSQDATSLYVRWGDWFAAICLAYCVVLALIEWRARHTMKRRSAASNE